uniref:Putative secreted protein n=1 Tax=Anopheles triannulatus TaxID=58253 RepID=A0A2M4B792_9DIPT
MRVCRKASGCWASSCIAWRLMPVSNASNCTILPISRCSPISICRNDARSMSQDYSSAFATISRVLRANHHTCTGISSSWYYVAAIRSISCALFVCSRTLTS